MLSPHKLLATPWLCDWECTLTLTVSMFPRWLPPVSEGILTGQTVGLHGSSSIRVGVGKPSSEERRGKPMAMSANLGRQAGNSTLSFYLFSLIFFIFFIGGGLFFLMNMVYYCDNNSKHLIVLPMYLDIAQGAHIC